eukprot:Gregarina_sp_Poly_1__4927@NODE_2613_length_1919_cov_7_029158_g1656_i0_p1_GENE_NODE_2613_length_1919_cov_7_029158_g1656_i0NODE_2613_length_1919_cov_7_029158_g1656_i0_p1_ORF_typecomplete_len140_score9_95_NODE_2613_length_1919_cov_7_029158_g1656_i09721391
MNFAVRPNRPPMRYIFRLEETLREELPFGDHRLCCFCRGLQADSVVSSEQVPTRLRLAESTMFVLIHNFYSCVDFPFAPDSVGSINLIFACYLISMVLPPLGPDLHIEFVCNLKHFPMRVTTDFANQRFCQTRMSREEL